jgi:hypothetical protein
MIIKWNESKIRDYVTENMETFQFPFIPPLISKVQRYLKCNNNNKKYK